MGIPAHYEPSNTQEIRKNAAVFAIIQAVGWTNLFERLDGFNREVALPFDLNLRNLLIGLGAAHQSLRGHYL